MKHIDLERLLRKNILSLKPYSCARDEFQGDEGVFLDANENPFGDLNRYPDPRQSKLKSRLSALKHTGVANIFAGNGSDEVIDLTFRIFCNPGSDKALSFTPTYGMYKVCAAINDVEMLEIPLTGGFQLDLDAVGAALADPNLKVIFVCSPNNPTGNLMRTEDIEFILNRFRGIVFIDEAYIDFAGTPSFIGKIGEHANLVVSQTFSKCHGLAAARVGLAYSNPEIINWYNKVKYPYNVSLLNQQAAINELSDLETLQTRKTIILAEKQKLQTELPKIAAVRKIYPSDANFLLVEFSNANRVYEALVERKIITRNRSSVVRNCIRITVGTPDENALLLKSLNEIQTIL
jgi:histidinol-phosphate aminotransferase